MRGATLQNRGIARIPAAHGDDVRRVARLTAKARRGEPSSAASASSPPHNNIGPRLGVGRRRRTRGGHVCGAAVKNEESFTLELTEENVEKVLDEVRPYLMADGGNVELIEIDGLTVRLRLQVRTHERDAARVARTSKTTDASRA